MGMKKIIKALLGIGFAVFVGANLAQSRQPRRGQNAADVVAASPNLGTAFGKPQVVTGRITMMVPQQRLVVVAVRDSRVTVDTLRGTHRTVMQDGQPVSQSDIVTSVEKAPGEAELSFEVNSGTVIKIAGERVAL